MATTTNTEKKMTKREIITGMLSGKYQFTAEEQALLEKELVQLTNKSKAERKPTPRQIANGKLEQTVVEQMESGVQYTVTEIVKGFNFDEELSTQRMTAILGKLVEKNLVGTEKVKGGKTVYFLAE